MIWKVRGKELGFAAPLLMGILNITPDSFSDGGPFLDPKEALARARVLIEEGADLIDLGAESTRPGAEIISSEEERRRLLPVLRTLRGMTDRPISIDTTKPETAEACLLEGADIINDVSGLVEAGREMAGLVRRYEAGLVLMHRRGDPSTMQSQACYGDVVEEVFRELKERLAFALESGIEPSRIAVDPGLGFSKTAEHNLELIHGLERFHDLKRPVLLGPSRKSFIGKVTGRDRPADREFGTAAVVAVSILKGAQILRVHEPGKMRDVLKMVQAIQGVKHVRT